MEGEERAGPVSVSLRRVYLALGSNLGDREAHLRAAVRGLRAGGVEVLAASSLYETPPWGGTEQPAFLNAVVATRRSPRVTCSRWRSGWRRTPDATSTPLAGRPARWT